MLHQDKKVNQERIYGTQKTGSNRQETKRFPSDMDGSPQMPAMQSTMEQEYWGHQKDVSNNKIWKFGTDVLYVWLHWGKIYS